MFIYKKTLTNIAILTASLMMATGALAESPQVCFYTGENFTGNMYCESGERTVNLAGKAPWEGNIKSIKLIDGASVKIYNQPDRTGNMELVEKSTQQLGANFFNKIASYRTITPYTPEEETVYEVIEEPVIEYY